MIRLDSTKKIALVLGIVILGLTETSWAQTWDCGHPDNVGGAASVKATLSGGTLTISGTGAMANYSENINIYPWYSSRNSITNVIILNGVTSIGDETFPICTRLTSITIPNSVTSIGDRAFLGCTGLTSITIPSSVTSIGSSAFSGCTGLTSITIPSSVTSIGSSAFFGCTGLTSITIPNSVTSIGSSAFYGCTGLTSITIPNSVTSIGVRTFFGCTGLTFITIPNSVTSIGDGAFSRSGLTSITIPNSVTSIGDGAFLDCTGLTSIDVEYSNANYSSENGVLFNKNKTILIQYPIGKQGSYIIIESVTSIGVRAFEGCTGLTSITIPNSVASIGDRAFFGCNGLTYVTIPNSVTSIGNEVFEGCTGLTFITIPNSVISIGNDAFSGSGLTSITIPNSVTSLGNRVFSGCVSLTSVTIGNGVTSIGSRAFSNCNNLTSIIIGNGVTSIDYNAFMGMHGLTTVISLNVAPPSMGASGLSIGGWDNFCLYVPQGSEDAYSEDRSGNNWRVYAQYCINSIPTGHTIVVFNSQLGSIVTPRTAVIGGKMVSPTAPTRIGYTFGGWFKEAACINPWDFNTDVTENMILHAKWNHITYTVTWNADGGTPAPTQTNINHGSNITAPATMSKTGYTFGGWYSDEALTSAVTFPIANVTTTRIFYAKWTLNNYAVTWNADGGTPVPTQTTVNHGNSITAPAAMTKTGYTFGGWYSDEALTSAVTFPIANVTTARTFYAKWTLNNYTITWNADGGTPIPTQVSVNHGSSVTAPAVMTKTGYTFSGWYSDAALTSAVTFPIANITAARTFYAKWTLNNYAVTWNSDGGTPVPTQTTVNHGNSITAPAVMSKTGYTFNGWYSDAALTSAVTFPIANITTVRTFYAKWTLNNYAVTWNSDGGTPAPTQTTINHGSSITAPATMTKTGYTFGGWYSDEALTSAVTFPIANVTTARTFYAKWTLNNYAITWNADGGTPIPTQTNVNHGSSITAPAAMTKTGYAFGGWYSNEALTTAVTFPIENVTTVQTLYAKWTFVPVTNIAISFPTTIGVGQEVKLSGTVEPQSANQTISWSVFSASPTGAVIIDNGTLFTVAQGTAFIRATVVSGVDNGTANYTQNFFITIGTETSVLSSDRIIPQPKPDADGANAVSVNKLTGEFTAGPNPVSRQSDIVNFFWQGKGIQNTKLSIYDASGNFVKKINNIRDEVIGKSERRIVGYWDLKDSKGRAVSEGTYLVRGVVVMADGKRERISVLVGVK